MNNRIGRDIRPLTPVSDDALCVEPVQDVRPVSSLSLRFLGRVEVQRQGQPVRLRSDSDRALLAYLAVESDRAHTRTALAELLWPEQPPGRARDNLRTTLAQVRKAIGNRNASPPFLPVRPRVLQFERESDYRLDVDQFRRLTASIGLLPAAMEAYDEQLVCQMQAAVDLYTGRFLAGLNLRHSAAFATWREQTAHLFHRQVMDLLRALATYALHQQQLDRAAAYARRQIELTPEQEDAHRLLMELYALSGQTEQARAQFHLLQETLAELDAAPEPQTMALYEQIAEGRLAPHPSVMGPASPAHRAGAITGGAVAPQPPAIPRPWLPCFGRDREREQIGQLLRHTEGRLLTLLGIGGIGKTRLALQVSEDCAEDFPDGVYFVSLAAVGNLHALVTAVATALRFSFQEGGDPAVQLLRHLRARRLLLVLDNFEHLIPHRAFVDNLLAQTDTLKLLVTSRERLGLEGEQSLRVEELAYPPAGEDRWLDSYPAVSLFVYCARLLEPDFHLTAENGPAVARICQLVVGLPLGIRLAAALTRLHTPHQIAADLAQRLDFPSDALPGAPARQRNIGAVFDYSWQRLCAAEQSAMCRLSVFQGGFSWEAAQAVSAPGRATLLALLDKSLVSRNSFDRFEIHELIRIQAAQRLARQPFAAETQRKHAHYYLTYLEERATAIADAEPTTLQEITPEIENLRTGLLWMLAEGEAALTPYVELLGQFYQRRHRYQDAQDLYATVFARLKEDAPLPAIAPTVLAHWQRLWGEALYKSGQMQASQERLLAALAVLDRSLPPTNWAASLGTGLELLRQVAHRVRPTWLARRRRHAAQERWLEAARTYERLGQILYFANQSEQAVYTAIRGLNLAERCGPSPVLARLYANMCLGLASIPWLPALPALYGRRAIQTARSLDHAPSLGWALELVGIYRVGVADWEGGLYAIEQSIAIHAQTGNPRQREEGLAVLAFIHQCRGQFEAALDAWRRAFHSAYQRGDRQVQMWSLSGIIENLMIQGEEARLARVLPDQLAGPDAGSGSPPARIRFLLEQANDYYAEIGDNAAQISAYAFLGLHALRTGDVPAALTQARAALHLMQTASSMTCSNLDGYSAATEVMLSVSADPPASVAQVVGQAELTSLAGAACRALRGYARAFPVAQPYALRWEARRNWQQGRHGRAHRLWQAGIRRAQQLQMSYVRRQIEHDRRQAQQTLP